MGEDEAPRRFRVLVRNEREHQARHQCVIELGDRFVAGGRHGAVSGCTTTWLITMGVTGPAPGKGP